jgi:hypothetical protein
MGCFYYRQDKELLTILIKNKMITKDDIADVGLAATDRLVELGYVKNCTDSDNEDEFEVQDVIREAIEAKLDKLGINIK